MVLVPCNLALARAEMAGAGALSGELGEALVRDVTVPGDWPPPLNDRDSMRFFLNMLQEGGSAAVGWGLWVFLLKSDDGLVAVGNGGFKGPPDQGGIVEVGYSLMPAHQRQGLAPEAVEALIGWASKDNRVVGYIAHTLADLTPSIRVLEKCGFTGPYSCSSPDPEVSIIRYERAAGNRG